MGPQEKALASSTGALPQLVRDSHRLRMLEIPLYAFGPAHLSSHLTRDLREPFEWRPRLLAGQQGAKFCDLGMITGAKMPRSSMCRSDPDPRYSYLLASKVERRREENANKAGNCLPAPLS